MCKILDNLHDYVPSTSSSHVVTLDDGTTENHTDYNLTRILMGGDQLTVARANTAKLIRLNHENSKSRLRGIVPVIEDWHSRLTLVKERVAISIIIYLFIYQEPTDIPSRKKLMGWVCASSTIMWAIGVFLCCILLIWPHFL